MGDAVIVSACRTAIGTARKGTLLDVSEDSVEFDPDAEDAFSQAVYHFLGGLLEQVVDVLFSTLPPPAK